MTDEYKQIAVGMLIFYKTKDSIPPERLWSGRVLLSTVGKPGAIPAFKVESLDRGYEGMTEWVSAEMVISYNRNKEGQNSPLVENASSD